MSQLKKSAVELIESLSGGMSGAQGSHAHLACSGIHATVVMMANADSLSSTLPVLKVLHAFIGHCVFHCATSVAPMIVLLPLRCTCIEHSRGSRNTPIPSNHMNKVWPISLGGVLHTDSASFLMALAMRQQCWCSFAGTLLCAALLCTALLIFTTMHLLMNRLFLYGSLFQYK